MLQDYGERDSCTHVQEWVSVLVHWRTKRWDWAQSNRKGSETWVGEGMCFPTALDRAHPLSKATLLHEKKYWNTAAGFEGQLGICSALSLTTTCFGPFPCQGAQKCCLMANPLLLTLVLQLHRKDFFPCVLLCQKLIRTRRKPAGEGVGQLKLHSNKRSKYI